LFNPQRKSIIPSAVYVEIALDISGLYFLIQTIPLRVFLCWFVGLRIAVVFLALFFDYLPHFDFSDTSRFGNTKALIYPFATLSTYVLLYQDM
jgi:hypothetical protein